MKITNRSTAASSDQLTAWMQWWMIKIQNNKLSWRKFNYFIHFQHRNKEGCFLHKHFSMQLNNSHIHYILTLNTLCVQIHIFKSKVHFELKHFCKENKTFQYSPSNSAITLSIPCAINKNFTSFQGVKVPDEVDEIIVKTCVDTYNNLHNIHVNHWKPKDDFLHTDVMY